MARANVTVIIDDQSFVIPNTESGSLVRAGAYSFNGLLLALGNTAERQQGTMTVSSPNDWIAKLATREAIGVDPDNNDHWSGDNAAGTTGAAWPYGPTGAWKNEWWAVHNYLQYGGICIVGATGTDSNRSEPTASANALANRSLPLDVIFAATGGSSQVNLVSTVATARGDCVGVVPDDSGGTWNVTPEHQGNADEFNVCVFGSKKHLDIGRGVDNTGTTSLVETSCCADVAGAIARTDRDAAPWFSPAGFKRGTVLDVVRLAYDVDEGEQDTLYDLKINPIVAFPGEGTVLFGDKTGAANTSTLSRINVSRLFIFLKKTIGAAARDKLFELNDSITRASFVNAVSPVLESIRARRGIYDYRVVCDSSNNTDALIDANQFIADIFIKPAKSINFIRITFTNKNTADSLE